MCPFHLGVSHSQGGSVEEELLVCAFTCVYCVAGIVHMIEWHVLPQCIDCDEELQIKTTAVHAYARVHISLTSQASHSGPLLTHTSPLDPLVPTPSSTTSSFP